MKKLLETLLAKAEENKFLLIKIGTTAVLTIAGVIVADVLDKAQNDMLMEEISMSLEE